MKKILSFILLALLPIVASAVEVEIDGIMYEVITKGKRATVIKGNYFGGVNIPESVTYDGVKCSVIAIGSSAFEGCRNLNSVTIPSSVTSIGGYAFKDCSGLTSVTIPNSVNSIDGYTFYRCSSLPSVTIPESVTTIGYYAFYQCSNLTSITIPESVTTIGSAAFYGCSGLTSVNIGNGVTTIYSYAFYGCSGLTSVIIPNSVTSIDGYAFYECFRLTSVTIPNSLTKIGEWAFHDCRSLTSVTIPNSLTSINSGTFSGCSKLTSVTIPNRVTSIGGSAFRDCSGLTSVIIPNSVTSIGDYAFNGCPDLEDVYCYVEYVPITGSSTFGGSYIEYATLHVPASAIELYKATEPWSGFGTIVSTDGDTPEPPKPEKCVTPTISYANGKLIFSSETEGAICQSTITDSDITSFSGNEVQLSATYTITVYATKGGYEDSEVATATLCWIDVAPQTEGIIDEDAVAEVKALPVLIQTQGGTISIQGAVEGTPIAVYDTDGKQYGTTFAEKDRTNITTSLRPGSIAVVKIGEKAVKVLLK